MKSIGELRMVLTFHPEEINSMVKSFANDRKIDFDVYLPSIKMNLQRDFCWKIEQKRELIWSILMKRNIPRMAMIQTRDGVYQVIDGKQRLSTMIDFFNNKFELEIDNKLYLFKQLPIDYQVSIAHFNFPYYIVYDGGFYGTITDQQKIDWFNFINLSGTPQDKRHFNKLNKLKNKLRNETNR